MSGPMDSKGKTFDTEYHDAITQIPAPSEDLKGKVVDVIEKGYLLNDRVIRTAKVKVSKNEAQPSSNVDSTSKKESEKQKQ